MKKIKVIYLLVLVAFIFSSCGPTPQSLSKRINGLEQELFSEQSAGIDKTKANELINTYIEYADIFPDDSISPDYLFRAADISMNLFESGQAIEIYNRIIDQYPEYEKVPQCLFLKAFVYENNLNDLVNAKRFYQEFLQKYPDNDFADDARMSIRNLGKSPEELIKEFEEKPTEESKTEE